MANTAYTSFTIPRVLSDAAEEYGINVADAARYGIQQAINASPVLFPDSSGGDLVKRTVRISAEMQTDARRAGVVVSAAAISGVYAAVQKEKEKRQNELLFKKNDY